MLQPQATQMTDISEDKAREILSAAGLPPTPFIAVTPEGILIASGYSEALARLLRWVPKAKWRPDKRAWLVPLAGADAMRSVLPEIIRLAEAAVEERRAEKAQAPDAGTPFDKEWLAALGQAVNCGSDAIAALTQSAAPQNIALSEIEHVIAALRGEALRITRTADQLEVWLQSMDRARKSD
jgi:hypothetical protein